MRGFRRLGDKLFSAGLARRNLLGARIAGGVSEINMTCPAIAPTLEVTELIVNGGFSVDANWLKGSGWTIAGNVGVGTNTTALIDQLVGTPGVFHQLTYTLVSRTANSVNGYLGASLLTKSIPGIYTGTAVPANNIVGVNGSGAGGFSGTIDDVSCKQINVASMLAFLGDISRRDGTYTCNPTVAVDSQCGMVVEYADINNFVLAYVDRVTGKAHLVKRIGGGVFQNVTNGAITYVAGRSLQVIVNNTIHTLKYNGIQVGSPTAISDAGLGTKVYGFNALAGNTVGVVTTSPN